MTRPGAFPWGNMWRRDMIRKILAAALAASLSLAGAYTAAAQDAGKVGVVVKIGGIPWFNAMEAGIKERGEKLGVDAFMVGPTSADPALQVRAIEDLIAQNVKVIGVVPNDAKVLEPVLTKAREKGIIVITHESPSQKGADWDFELASATGFGEAHAKLLAEKMGGKGEYAVFVGSLTVPLHNAWADAAIEYIKKNHPEMTLVGDRYGVAEDVDKSRSTALDLISAHPNSKAFLPSEVRGRSVPGAPSRSAARSARSSFSGPSRPVRARSSSGPMRFPAASCESQAGRRSLRDARRQAHEGRGNQGRRGNRRSRRDPPRLRKPQHHRRPARADQQETVADLAAMGL